MAAFWPFRGLLRSGVVTTKYPNRPEGLGQDWPGAVEIIEPHGGDPALDAICPTGAIGSAGERLSIDRGRCILCARCTTERPDVFRFTPAVEVARTSRAALVVPPADGDEPNLARVRADLAHRVAGLQRSVHIRHVDAGSDGSDEWEVAALTNPIYDVQRLGIFFTATPRHADILLITGAGSRGMQAPLQRAYEAMPRPRVVIAAGTDAVSGGLTGETYATCGGIGRVLPVDVWIPGSPPTPFGLLHGILLALGRVGEAGSP